MKPRRERMAPWKAIICFFRGHDWGMFYNPSMPVRLGHSTKSTHAGGYEDICVRCGARK